MANLKIAVPEIWEQWAEKRERPLLLKVRGKPRLWLPSGHIILPPIAGGARLFNDATSQFLENTTAAPVTAAPMTVACWFRSDDVAANQALVQLQDKDVENHRFTIFALGGTAGDPLRWQVIAGVGASIATTTTGFSANTWHHACAVEIATNSRSCYIDGGSEGTNAESKIPLNVDSISIGRAGDSSPATYMSGDIAEVAIWDVALSDGDVALLAKAVSALMVHPESLVFYCPIIGNYSPEIELMASVGMTVTGATKSVHPRIFYPSMPLIREKPAAVGANVPFRGLTMTGVGR